MTKREKDADITVITRKDGDVWFAHGPDFTNLQESYAEFGSTPEEAAVKYLGAAVPNRCKSCKNCIDVGYTLFGMCIANDEDAVLYERKACDKWESKILSEEKSNDGMC